MSVSNGLARVTFETSRQLEFFTEKELTMQVGWDKLVWPLALLKELIDNGLDSCESADIPPEIVVTVEEDAFSVQDNGTGLPRATLERSLDYSVRVSDKSHYVAPTRGQLGNALKCLWAAPFVAAAQAGRVDVVTHGERHTIEITIDRLRQEPVVRLASLPVDGFVKNGTLVRVEWPQVAGYLGGIHNGGLHGMATPATVLRDFALFNPHARFTLRRQGCPEISWSPTDPSWTKWRPSTPTSAHWYTADRLRELIAAYVVDDERKGSSGRTVREFVSEFHGLSGSVKPKAVLEATGLARTRLAELVVGDDIDLAQVTMLLDAMKAASRPVKPAALGVIGRDHFTERLVSQYGVNEQSIVYRKVEEVDDDGLPMVLEVAFGALREDRERDGRQLAAGVNWAAALALPFQSMPFMVGQARADPTDPVVLIAHLAKPGAQFADRGKGRLSDV